MAWGVESARQKTRSASAFQLKQGKYVLHTGLVWRAQLLRDQVWEALAKRSSEVIQREFLKVVPIYILYTQLVGI